MRGATRASWASQLADLLMAALVSACSGDPLAAPHDDQRTDAVGGAGGTTDAAGGAGGTATGSASSGEPSPCAVNEIELLVSAQGGIPYRFHVAVRYEGRDAALLFDTGSAMTFVRLDDPAVKYVPRAGTVELGCESGPIAGRGGLADLGEVAGLPVIGILGADYVARGTTLVDHVAGRLIRHPPRSLVPEVAGWAAAGYDDVQGYMIAPAKLGGEPVRLVFDTGANHCLHLGEDGQPGDVPVDTTDAEGNAVHFFFGHTTLEMAGEPGRVVPVLRAPSFPLFEQVVASLGGDIQGLVGLSGLGGRRFAVDGENRALLLEPLER